MWKLFIFVMNNGFIIYSPPMISKRKWMHKLCVYCIVQGVRSEAYFLSHCFYKHKDFHDIIYMSWKSHFTLFLNFHGHFDQSLLLYFLLTSDCSHDTEWGTPLTSDKKTDLVNNNFRHLSVLQSESVALLSSLLTSNCLNWSTLTKEAWLKC